MYVYIIHTWLFTATSIAVFPSRNQRFNSRGNGATSRPLLLELVAQLHEMPRSSCAWWLMISTIYDY